MNKIIPKIGAAIVTITVFLFAVFMIVDIPFGSYLVCMILPIGYIMMVAGFHHESAEEQRVSANIGMVFSAILDYQRGGLFFNYDLLGYGMMALSTLFTGISIEANSKADKWLKYLMMIHGVFFIGCFLMPMTGVFTSMADGNNGYGGTIALLFWCAYFMPIGILSYRHFGKGK